MLCNDNEPMFEKVKLNLIFLDPDTVLPFKVLFMEFIGNQSWSR